MTARVLKGSKQEIAESISRMSGEVREAVVFVDEPAEANIAAAGDDIFAEMEPHVVRTGGADYSREAIYGRTDSE